MDACIAETIVVCMYTPLTSQTYAEHGSSGFGITFSPTRSTTSMSPILNSQYTLHVCVGRRAKFTLLHTLTGLRISCFLIYARAWIAPIYLPV